MAGYYNFAHQGQLTPNAISRDIEYLAYHGSPYARLMKEIRRTKDDIMSGNDVQFMSVDTQVAKIVNEFVINGTDTIKIPIWDRFTSVPSAGDDTLIGKGGAALQVAQRPVYINAIGDEFPVNTARMNTIRSKNAAPGGLVKLSRGAIGDWWSNILTEMLTRTIYEGSPHHISVATAEKSPYILKGTPLNKGRRHHRHLLVAGQTQPTWSATHSTYDTNINTALSACNGDGSNAAKAGADSLMQAYEYMLYQQMEYFGVANGIPFWMYYATPEQFREFGQDSRIEASTRSAFRGAKNDDPGLVGGALFFQHFQIVCEPKIAWEIHYDCLEASDASSTAGYKVRYGAMDALKRYELNNAFNYQSVTVADRYLKAGVIMGKRVMTIGQAGTIDTWEVPSDDKRSTNIYSDMVVGASRNDTLFGTDSDTPDSVVCKGSVIHVTRSPAL